MSNPRYVNIGGKRLMRKRMQVARARLAQQQGVRRRRSADEEQGGKDTYYPSDR
jgi:hypothetical protein